MHDSFLNSGIGFIAQVQEERAGQIRREGFTAEHDDEHRDGELARAAACYAMPHTWRTREMLGRLWPWLKSWFKPAAIPDRPQARQRELIKAAALLYAEFDRLERHILRINSAPADTLAAAVITEPEDFPPLGVCRDNLTPFELAIKYAAEFNESRPSCHACRIDASGEPVKSYPRHTCGKDGPVDDHTQLKKSLKIDQGELANKCGWPRPGIHNPDNPEPEQESAPKNQAYNERVQALAEKMAADQYFKEYGPHSTLNDTANKDKWIDRFIPQAVTAENNRQQVIEQINVITPLMQEQYMRHDYRQMWELWQALLVQVGLIPDDGQEGRSDA